MIKTLFPYHPAVKLLGVGLFLFAFSGFIYKTLHQHDFVSFAPAFQIASLGLVFIFFSKEKYDDERVHQIKFRSLTWGVLTAYFLTLAVTYLFRSLSAHEFLCLALLLTTGMFYVLKQRA
ncbi:hypothetical protein [Parachryseolinea silvisoli]|uniref:hypothetical protein n=1 Tax=Parachryseolinea silvisoli TaxID=2873601 RepID=UPI0022659488|nr:hypothetical protein [Parachryseolinea silvisoli]MCD9014183.1 hypothetical protein [Parachryseolinea silvisoli]